MLLYVNKIYLEIEASFMTNIESEDKLKTLDYDREIFIKRVEESMLAAKLDFDALAKKFAEEGYAITSSNLKLYITKRNPSIKLLIYLSKTLHTSIDYLIGNEIGNSIPLNQSFDREIYSSRYAQYPGKYIVYFFPTRTNEPEELIEAKLEISSDNSFRSILRVPVPEGADKEYDGHLVLSKKTNTAFLSMIGTNGEMIQFTFNDPHTNQNKLRFCISGLISVSSGDAKRMPTLSRAVICESELSSEGIKYVKANLRLNSKYINIHEEKLLSTLTSFLHHAGIEDINDICSRLQYAFKARTYYSLEEQYLLNTFRLENGFSDSQIESLIAELRNNSMSSINVKIPRSLDARLYLLLTEKKMFMPSSPENAKDHSKVK